MNSGTADRMHSTVPATLPRVWRGANAARRSRTMSDTPEAVANGSVSRKAYAFTCAAHVMNTATAAATSTSSTHRPMPAAACSEMAAPGRSLSAASKSSATGESTHSSVAAASFGAAACRSAR